MSPIPAATIMIMHITDPKPEFLLVLRNRNVRYQGNVWVFPGGRVDAIDQCDESNLNAMRACAVRETQEEAGLILDPTRLTKVVRCETPEGMPERFDAHFYLACLQHEPAVQVDGHEIVDYRWLTAEEALLYHHQNEIRLSPSVFVLLSWSISLGTADNFVTHFSNSAPQYFKPRYIPLADGGCNLYQGDVAYDTGDLRQTGTRHRLWMRKSRWLYEGGPIKR